ncbi:biotin carboxyl carrier domain-containing protein [Affinibrenneria salicis]|uniref:Biotin carboxyl carrier protein of acetyl-CoA carboxylase n=1 Tax=Affinibrenneria salicis TaxID=2590031 RepID=A0A5J5FZA4_9GAMM|nr:acetyl-CoA carboxylase [Affinibrenneria salicis]KAA8999365.1 biotin carboxyl carrier domain-containing protein [Affinibrenneria salicis]
MSTHEIISPLPGIFYRQPAPESPPFINPGDTVESTTVIGLIEVMKQFTEIYAEQTGQLQAFAINNGEAIEPGQIIAIIKTDS